MALKHPFSELKAEYAALLKGCQITRFKEADAMARKLLGPGYRPKYEAVTKATGIPVVVLAAIHMRESSNDFSTYLGNGEPLNRVTRLVPRGRGPFKDWVEGALDGIKYDGLDQVSAEGWTWEFACWKGEKWNGFGPRAHGIHTGYLWAGTNRYSGGKYVADGKWDAGHFDQQLGMVPVMLRMAQIAPELDLARQLPRIVAGPSIVPAPVPEAIAGTHDAKWIQHALNVLEVDGTPILEDGDYGRITRQVVRAYQIARGLKADGYVGPVTGDALAADYAARAKTLEKA